MQVPLTLAPQFADKMHTVCRFRVLREFYASAMFTLLQHVSAAHLLTNCCLPPHPLPPWFDAIGGTVASVALKYHILQGSVAVRFENFPCVTVLMLTTCRHFFFCYLTKEIPVNDSGL